MTSSRTPSLARIARYVREEMIAGTTESAVMTGGGRHADKATTTVRWRVWARLRAERYSHRAIAAHFGVDRTTVLHAVREIAKGRAPYDGVGLGDKPRKRELQPQSSAPRLS